MACMKTEVTVRPEVVMEPKSSPIRPLRIQKRERWELEQHHPWERCHFGETTAGGVSRGPPGPSGLPAMLTGSQRREALYELS